MEQVRAPRGNRSLARRAAGRARAVAAATVPPLLRAGARPVATLRDVLNPDLRRPFRSYWARRGRLLAGAAAIVAAGAVVGALTHWLVLAVVLAPFVVEALHLAGRRRPTWGRSRGWPPGSVGVGTETMMRFDGFANGARTHGPVFKSNYFADPLVGIVDLERGITLFRDHADDLGHRPLRYNRHVPGGAIRWAAEPHHADLRRSFARALSPRLVADWAPTFGEMMRACLEPVAAAGAAGGAAPRVFLRDAARGICSAFLLGIGPEDEAYPEVRERMERLDICRPSPVSAAETEAHLDRLAELVRDRARAAVPGPPASVAVELERHEPGVLDDPGVVRNLLYLALGPRDDVAGLLVWVCWYLARHPWWILAVRRADAGSDLPARIVSETLRLDQSEYVMRVARREIPIDDWVIPEGWLVRVCIREIHRDPAHFPEPTHFDPDRFLGGPPPRDVYAPLGIDHHSCIGEALARTVAETFVRELAARYDVEVVADGPRGLNENGHWAPAPEFRVRLVAGAGDPSR